MYNLIRTTKQFAQLNLTKQIVRHNRTARRRRIVDPGIQNRKDIVNDDKEFVELTDYDFDLEADFMSVHKTHKQHEEEQILKQEQQKYLIVGQKYFKEKLPNFLIWSEKEQIRYLYDTNPDEWTIEKLSEGFPALPEVIAKIVKSKWTKDSENKICKHDESVKRNWAMFKKGSLKDLPPDLVEHLQKFTNREQSFKHSIDVPETNNKKMVAPNIKIGTEFSQIISSYKRLKNDNNDINNSKENIMNSEIGIKPKKDTYILGGNSKMSRKHVTLNNLQQRIEKRDEKGKDLVVEEKMILNALKEYHHLAKSEQSIQHPVEMNQVSVDKYSKSSRNSTAVTTFKENKSNALDYPEKIIIPKNKYKPGYTYKLNDCYYDDDGEFLYRVPGMYK